ncbi:unnamed protein product, partial [marine sediment metagenome]
MIGSNTILVILNSLESPRTSFKATIDKFIKEAIKIANESKDFRAELELYDDIIYHIYIYDIDYNIWIKKKECPYRLIIRSMRKTQKISKFFIVSYKKYYEEN